MSNADQVHALEARLGAFPGIKTVWSDIPDDAPDEGMLPAFGINLLPFLIDTSNVTVFTYPVQIVYLHERFPDDWEYGPIADTVLNMPEDLHAWLAADAILMHGLGAYSMQTPESEAGSMGTVTLWNQVYAGCSFMMAYKRKVNTIWA